MSAHSPAARPAGCDFRRVARGLTAHARGQSAEQCVLETYQGRGCTVLNRRWRGPAGEVDLILRDGASVVFVEVKRAATHDAAAARISRSQMDRICLSALAYCDSLPDGSLTAMRFDAALVDDAGRVSVIENAFGLN